MVGQVRNDVEVLEGYTDGVSRGNVTSVHDKNGWEVWRKLHQQFEPGVVMTEAVVVAQFTNIVNKRAKNTMETNNLLVELEEKAKRVEDVTGERIDNRHMMSVIMGILDTETLKHTAQYQGSKVKAETLKRKVMELANLMGTGKTAKTPWTLEGLREGAGTRCQKRRKEVKKEIKNNSTDSETLATIVEGKDIGPEIA